MILKNYYKFLKMLFANRNTGTLISKEEEANTIISDIAYGDTLVLSTLNNKN